jgi:ribonuclease III
MAKPATPVTPKATARMDEATLERCERALGHRFSNRRLLEEALTHPSFSLAVKHAVPSNQRLEFVGDAVIGLVFACWLLEEFPEMREGEMTRLRAGLVRAPTLARVAEHLGVEAFLRTGPTGEAERVAGRERALSDALEALSAAVFLDAGQETAARVVRQWFVSAGLHVRSAEAPVANPKGALQELLQPLRGNACVLYELVEAIGPDHNRRFTVRAIVDGETWGTGSGDSKKSAEEAAATEALKRARRP